MQDKRRRWQLGLILIVAMLTIYNILPTVFYYRQPLRDPIDAPRAEELIEQIASRVDDLTSEQIAWLESFLKLIGVEGAVFLHPQDASLFCIKAATPEGARAFRQFLPRAGALIPFVPAQLSLSQISTGDVCEVWVSRAADATLSPPQQYFQFSPYAEGGRVPTLARHVITDRVATIVEGLVGKSLPAELLEGWGGNREHALAAALQIANQFSAVEQMPVAARERALNHMFRGANQTPSTSLMTLFEQAQATLASNRAEAHEEAIDRGLQRQAEFLSYTQEVIKLHAATLDRAPKAMALHEIEHLLRQGPSPAADAIQEIDLGHRNGYFHHLRLNWGKGELALIPYEDLRSDSGMRWFTLEAAQLARTQDERVSFGSEQVTVLLKQLNGATGMVVLDLPQVIRQEMEQLKSSLQELWKPEHPELQAATFPIWTLAEYQAVPPAQRQLGLVLYSPLAGEHETTLDMPQRSQSIYVFAKGLQRLSDKYVQAESSPEAKTLRQDMEKLQAILQAHGLYRTTPGVFSLWKDRFKADFVFAKDQPLQQVLAATREDFHVQGSGRYAVLEVSDVEQRLLTLNRIETQQHEDLLKWRDEYRAAQVAVDPLQKYDVPAPTHNAFLSNFALSARKYWRGDDRKILRWGLDLSGGKTVRLELKDAQGQTVTNPDDLRQGLNELQQRVNRMGVSETTLRQEGSTLVIDFPGLQSLSASELVKGSSMYFHIVNEKFSSRYSPLYEATQQFLQEVWNEAVVTNRKDPLGIQQIARAMLGQSEAEQFLTTAVSPAATSLLESGLHLADPTAPLRVVLEDRESMVVMLRGDGPAQWMGQTHPLLLTFRNYALEGSQLEQVHSAYDTTKGNYLAFQVKSNAVDRQGGAIHPQELFYAWTSEFAQDRIVGTPREPMTGGRGWRMAVVLNGSVISAPALESALHDSAMITGSFSQREVNHLVADLKAGSLTFTPTILSEASISPELGAEERLAGVASTILALVAVILVMMVYYRLAGVVASVALVVNLLILWAVLQNIQATLTLPGLAGIVLTLGMAVDANVLVFERMREEFAASGRLAQAVTAGYKKSFSAILDSNITTMIAGVILLNFDSGPLKGFALTLIIGVVSSMFTALFLTRFVFEGWVQKGRTSALHMMQAFKRPSLNFLKWGKTALYSASVLIVVGLVAVYPQRNSLFGIDFTGGYTVQLEASAPRGEAAPRLVALRALGDAGLPPGSYQVRELNRPQDLMIQLSHSLDEKGRPFAGMSLRTEKNVTYAFQNNPRLNWIVHTLSEAGLVLKKESLPTLDTQWSALSGQYSDTMRWAAVISLSLAIAAMLVYLALRFEWRYAIAAIVCLANDVLVTIAVVVLLAFMGLSVTIDMAIVAALMTILGYSLNDTIIIFDRIREDVQVHRRIAFPALCNQALNETLSRTVMTSGTTLLVVLILLAVGGPAIFGFALTLFIGILIGTMSSWVIATPVLVWLQKVGHPATLSEQEV